ncbi:MAG: molybdopterin-dependent oxidoreductase, partial [Bacteroidales bacterium]|nr:molybdopterin-dependent oxidoreductase [Bacteroidales bacterium]
QVQNGGGFGGKEDITVQGHASLFAYLLKKPVRVHLTRDESLIMHPKRHPVHMEISLACDRNGKFTAVRLHAVGDTGAYASVGTKVMERVVGTPQAVMQYPRWISVPSPFIQTIFRQEPCAASACPRWYSPWRAAWMNYAAWEASTAGNCALTMLWMRVVRRRQDRC